jgi:hypothetical protein
VFLWELLTAAAQQKELLQSYLCFVSELLQEPFLCVLAQEEEEERVT